MTRIMVCNSHVYIPAWHQPTLFDKAVKIFTYMENLYIAFLACHIVQHLKGVITVRACCDNGLYFRSLQQFHVVLSVFCEFRLIAHLICPSPATRFIGPCDAHIDPGFLQKAHRPSH